MAETELTLRPLESSHLSAAVALDHLCLGGWWGEQSYRNELDRDSSDLIGLFAHPTTQSLASDSLAPPDLLGLGCQWLILDEAHIILLMVHPHYRSQGLGLRVLLGLLTQAHQRGAACATLEVRASNAIARQLYGKLGFQGVGQRPHYYQNPDEDALILWCRGLQRPAFGQQLRAWQAASQQRLGQGGWHLPTPEFGTPPLAGGITHPKYLAVACPAPKHPRRIK
ncbi:ribosomal protein S18-alanine N-acetyltransferase [Synechococcales cyanobacterium C]|uniref:Ribosomal protein S18-alanine N-acetyltransferase n=1 Tax=Petrachloros mirabilis ULC683 TaxID=2781853 RepID=A0A8K1ZX75_9CYAN|nr:ribosomal protein S18-alanine N-acetyltransferase [Petrachloros mirabilis]NCJ05681.1 ribosomal protein S18-alanine N-acetyltransferase [Petrachloros mirabilis ULC683]